MVLSVCSTKTNAQNIKYQGEAAMGYAFGIGDFNVNRFNISTTHGVRLNQYLFVGGGLGFNFFHKDGDNATVMPIYASVKGYYPVGNQLSLVGLFDLGVGTSLSDNLDGSGFYCYPQVGLNLPILKSYSLDFTLGYQHQAISKHSANVNFDAIAFKVAFNW